MHLLLSPLTWLVLALCCLRVTRGRVLRTTAWLVLMFSAVMAAPVGANTLVWLIENRLPSGAACELDERAPVLILTGGFDRAPLDQNDFAALTIASLRRLSAGLEVAARRQDTHVIISGASYGDRSEAEVAGELAQRLGFGPSRLTIEPNARNTWENAAETAKLLAGTALRVQLVTSALHAPRAALALQAHGMSVCRQFADSIYTPFTGPGYFAPQSSSLSKTERALHELVGLVSYRMKAARRD